MEVEKISTRKIRGDTIARRFAKVWKTLTREVVKVEKTQKNNKGELSKIKKFSSALLARIAQHGLYKLGINNVLKVENKLHKIA